MANIKEITIKVEDSNITISDTGVWIDDLNAEGCVTRSIALAWEEMTTDESVMYYRLYQVALAMQDDNSGCYCHAISEKHMALAG